MPTIRGSAVFVPTRGQRVRLWLAMAAFAAAVGISALIRMVRATFVKSPGRRT